MRAILGSVHGPRDARQPFVRRCRLGGVLVGLVLGMLPRPALAQINLLANGSFEEPRVRTALDSQTPPPPPTPTLPGWRIVEGSATLAPYSTWQQADYQGKQTLLLGGSAGAAAIEQNVATVPGQSYLVSGWFTRTPTDRSVTEGRVQVTVGTDPAVEFAHGTARVTTDAMRWKLFAHRFKATSEQTIVRFTGSGVVLDGLTVAFAGSPMVSDAFFTVDLSRFLTHRLADGLLGWGNDLVDLGDSLTPQNPLPLLRGVPFLLDGVVMVGPDRVNEVNLLRRVQGIPIRRKAKRLHFLHANQFSQISKGTVIAEYAITYADLSRFTLPLRYGLDLADWWTYTNSRASEAQVAWLGRNEGSARWDRSADFTSATGRPLGIQLFLKTWDNPFPDLEIQSVDLVYRAPSSAWYATTFLVGLTGEK